MTEGLESQLTPEEQYIIQKVLSRSRQLATKDLREKRRAVWCRAGRSTAGYGRAGRDRNRDRQTNRQRFDTQTYLCD